MRINHTPYELYRVFYLLPCKSDLFKDVKRWYYYKGYSTKQGALNAMKRLKNSDKFYPNEWDLIFKIVWCPYPLADEDKCILVYSDEKEVV